jgi:hypothetical protein
MSRALLAVLLVLLLPGALAGQQFGVDAEPIGGSLSLAWGRPGHRWGLGLGLGVPQFPGTIEPSGEDFEEYLHVATFLRRGRGAVEADAGLRVSVADLWPCEGERLLAGRLRWGLCRGVRRLAAREVRRAPAGRPVHRIRQAGRARHRLHAVPAPAHVRQLIARAAAGALPPRRLVARSFSAATPDATGRPD